MPVPQARPALLPPLPEAPSGSATRRALLEAQEALRQSEELLTKRSQALADSKQ